MRKFSRHQPPSPFLPLLQSIQAHFGLTQGRVADVVGVSRETLGQEGKVREQGSVRGLPSAAMLRLLTLQRTLPAPYGPAPTPAAEATAPDLPAYDQETLRMRQQQIGIQEFQLQKKLSRCRQHLAQARLRQQALPALRAAFTPANELTQQWLTLFEREAHRMLKQEAPAAALLELRLRVLAFEAAEITRLLAEPAGAE